MKKKKPAPPDALTIEQGDRIKKEREKREWSQKQLSAACAKAGFRFSTGAIGNHEQYERRLTIDRAKILEVVLERPAAYFLGLLDEKEADIIWRMRSNSQ